MEDRIADWRVLEPAGSGRVGRAFVVFRENDPTRHFILKQLRVDVPGLTPETLEKEADRLRMAKVPRRMPTLIESGMWRGVPYLVTEALEGIDFPIPPKKYRAFCIEAFTALGDLHREKILHCDLTSNHLRWKGGNLAFIDYDSSHSFAEAVVNKDCFGTDPYIAPEVASQGRLSVRSDLYALAMILLDHCHDSQRDCLEPVLRECLRPRAEDRPADAAAVVESLRTCRPPHHRFKSVLKWTGIVLVTYGVIASVSYHFRRLQVRSHVMLEKISH